MKIGRFSEAQILVSKPPKVEPLWWCHWEGFEVLPKFRPVRTRISGVKAHYGEAADEPFSIDIGGLLPIALCGLISL